MRACPAPCDEGYFDNGTCVADVCDRCEGEGRVESWYDRLPGARGLRRQYHVRRYVLDHRLERIRHYRQLWKDREAPVVGSWLEVDRRMLADEPALQSLIEHQLMTQLADFTPLSWRVDEARRRMRGDLDSPWAYETTVSVKEEGRDLFERNRVVLLAERRRVPKS